MKLLRYGNPIQLTEKGARLLREAPDRKGVVVADQRRGAVQVIVRFDGQVKARAVPVGWVEKASKR